ncbi:MAG TPA: patatin-like phospholipase family protein, partial [Deltaproteobacteria bacterium]|nr:patatin-like phospholipase family protein [Deltaproteobacteria bacterium]
MPYEVGVALGGGGVRGLANVGALKALLDAGVKPACVSGTSMGAI